MKTSRTEINNYIVAKDVGGISPNAFAELLLHDRTPVAYSVGTYGVNAVVWYDKHSERFYKLTERSSRLLQII